MPSSSGMLASAPLSSLSSMATRKCSVQVSSPPVRPGEVPPTPSIHPKRVAKVGSLEENAWFGKS